MFIYRITLLGPAILSLAACSGDASYTPNIKEIRAGSSYAQMANAFDNFQEEKIIKVTAPSKGSGTYNGVGSFDLAGGDAKKPDLLGHARLTADFGKKTINGGVSDFKTANGKGAVGKISVDGKINGKLIDGKLSGMVDVAGTKYDLGNDQKIHGAFRDDDIKAGEIPDSILLGAAGKTMQGAGYNVTIKAEEQKAHSPLKTNLLRGRYR